MNFDRRYDSKMAALDTKMKTFSGLLFWLIILAIVGMWWRFGWLAGVSALAIAAAALLSGALSAFRVATKGFDEDMKAMTADVERRLGL